MPAMRMLSINIRTGVAEDKENSWPYRRDSLFQGVREMKPDLVALQEPTGGQWAETLPAFPGYRGEFADALDPKFKVPHGVAVLYRADRFEPKAQRIFWQSTTPDEPGTRLVPNLWGPRPTLAVRLFDHSDKKEFVLASTHVDPHPGGWLESIRVNAAELDRFAGGLPIVLAGDFNCAARCEGWKLLRQAGYRDAWDEAGLPDEGLTTFHGFKGTESLSLETREKLSAELREVIGEDPHHEIIVDHILECRNYRIDWIMLRGPWKVSAAGRDTRRIQGRLITDHFPVWSDLALSS